MPFRDYVYDGEYLTQKPHTQKSPG